MKDFAKAKKLLESTGHLVVEKKEKKTFDTFMTYLMDHDGKCSADGGDDTFYCLKLNDDNFSFDAYPEFKKQVEAEGLYDRSWVAGIIPNKELERTGGKIPVGWLPIFGRRDKYETKWLQNGTPSSAVEEVLRDRRMKIKSSIDYFNDPEERQLQLHDLEEPIKKLGLAARIGSTRRGDYLETNVEFTREECVELSDIPHSSGSINIYLKNNKYEVWMHGKKQFRTVDSDKILDFIKREKDRMKLEEALNMIEQSGKKVIKESKPDYHHEKAMKITQLLDDTLDDLRYSDAEDLGEYFADRVVHYDLNDLDDIAAKIEEMTDNLGVRVSMALAEKIAAGILEIAGL